MHSEEKELILMELESYWRHLPVSVQVLLENVLALMMSVIDGRNVLPSFAKLDQDGSWLRMYGGCSQLMMDGSLEKYSGNFPTWGMMRAGECSEHRKLEHPTRGNGSSLWPTPRANKIGGYSSDGYSPTLEQSVNNWATPNTMDSPPSRSFDAMKKQATSGGRKNRKHPGNLREQVDPLMCLAYVEARAEANNWPTPHTGNYRSGMVERAARTGKQLDLQDCVVYENWPTPRSNDYKGGRSFDSLMAAGRNATNSLSDALTCENWSTPTGADCKGTTGGGQGRSLRTDTSGTGGQLNADWVERLMGYPSGWTDIEQCKKLDLFHELSIDEVFSGLWPAKRGELQYSWEPPRTISGQKDRASRIKMLGNAVVPQWAYITLHIINTLDRRQKSDNKYCVYKNRKDIATQG